MNEKTDDIAIFNYPYRKELLLFLLKVPVLGETESSSAYNLSCLNIFHFASISSGFHLTSYA